MLVLVAGLGRYRQRLCVVIAILLIGFILATALVGRAVVIVMRGRLAKGIRVLSFCGFAAAAVAACYMTFYYTYDPRPNERIHGWPIPVVIFQRDNADTPWLDFVGIYSYLALPVNFILFALLPSLAVIILSRRIS